MSAEPIEALLGATVVLIAIRLLWTADAFEALVGFMVFGLVLSLLWAAMGASDVALAEVAIGAGLSGALLLGAGRPRRGRADDCRGQGGSGLAAVPLLLGLLGAALGAALPVALDPSSPAPLTEPVRTALPRSGVESPVTAVLLNFRGYDTLLEVGVLVAAWLGATRPGSRPEPDEGRFAGDVPDLLARLWLPLGALVAGYVVWAGSRWPGGAFQSAALLAGMAVLLHLVGGRVGGLPASHPLFARLPVLGLLVFGVCAAAGLVRRGHLLAYPEGEAGGWILVIELAMTVSLAALLLALYHAVLRRRGAA